MYKLWPNRCKRDPNNTSGKVRPIVLTRLKRMRIVMILWRRREHGLYSIWKMKRRNIWNGPKWKNYWIDIPNSLNSQSTCGKKRRNTNKFRMMTPTRIYLSEKHPKLKQYRWPRHNTKRSIHKNQSGCVHPRMSPTRNIKIFINPHSVPPTIHPWSIRISFWRDRSNVSPYCTFLECYHSNCPRICLMTMLAISDSMWNVCSSMISLMNWSPGGWNLSRVSSIVMIYHSMSVEKYYKNRKYCPSSINVWYVNHSIWSGKLPRIPKIHPNTFCFGIILVNI